MTRNKKIVSVLQLAISKTGHCEWTDMVKAINAAGIKITNWMVVRGILQWMIDQQMVVRDADISVERYIAA
jgi:hypothetical protein